MSGWNIIPSAAAQRTKNPIRGLVDSIKIPENPTKTMIALSLGDPTVFGNLPNPDILVNLLVQNIQSRKHDGYLPSHGAIAARRALAEFYSEENNKLTENDVIIGCGCSGSLDVAIRGLLNPGDNILIPCPGYSLYRVITDSIGASVKQYRLIPERQWEIDIQDLESQIDGNTKAILLNNPSNPCGNVFSEEHLRQILEVAERHRLPIISDEIYGELAFSFAPFTPIARLTTTVPVIVTGGMAKQYCVPGWRVGWILIYDQMGILVNYKKGLVNLTQLILGPSSIVQSTLPELLQHKQELREFNQRYVSIIETNARICVERLSQIPGMTTIAPQGTIYLLVKINIELFEDLADDRDFAAKLLEEEMVFVLPGQCFGATNFIRIVFCAPDDKLHEAFDRIATFCQRHLKK